MGGVDARLDRMTDQQLLDLRLRDLRLKIEGTRLQIQLGRLYEELAARELQLRPHVWLSEEWFTPDGVAGFAIPLLPCSSKAHPVGTRANARSGRRNRRPMHAHTPA